MSVRISLITVADPVNYTGEFRENFEVAGNILVKVMAVHLLTFRHRAYCI